MGKILKSAKLPNKNKGSFTFSKMKMLVRVTKMTTKMMMMTIVMMVMMMMMIKGSRQ